MATCNHRSNYHGICGRRTDDFIWCCTDDDRIFKIGACSEHKYDDINDHYYLFETLEEAQEFSVTRSLLNGQEMQTVFAAPW